MSETHNDLSGAVNGTVFQVGTIHGDVIVGSSDRHEIAVPRQLPGDIRRFVGRRSELRALSAFVSPGAIESGSVIISALAGMGGVGKTALAVHWCHQVRERYTGGDLYADLRGFGPGLPMSPMTALEGFLRALGVPAGEVPTTLDQRAALYRSLLHERRILVLLDNAASTQQVIPLLPGSSSSLVVVTSRSSLSGLVSQHDAHRLELGVLSPKASASLVRGIGGPRRIKADSHILSAVLDICGGLPLALRIVGERFASHADLGVEVEEALAELSALLDLDRDGTAGIQSVFSWSYRALAQDLAQAFRLLGLYPVKDISLPGAAALLNLPVSNTRHALDTLADLHLVNRTAPGHYAFHDLVQSYAHDRAIEVHSPEERKAVLARLLTFYLGEAELYGRVLSDGLPDIASTRPDASRSWTQAVRWRDEEREHFEIMMREADGLGLDAITCGLAAQSRRVFQEWQAVPEGLAEALSAGLAAARRLGCTRAEAWINLNLGCHYTDLWRFGEAGDHLRSAAALFRAGEDKRGEAWALYELSRMHDLANEYASSFEDALQAVEIFRSEGDEQGEAIALLQLGRTHGLFARRTEEFDCLSEALTICRRLGRQRDEARVLYSIASAYHSRHEYDNSISCYESALTLARATNDEGREAWILYYIGCSHRDMDRNQEALHWYNRAMEVFRKTGDQWGRAWLLLDISIIRARFNELAVCLDLSGTALAMFRELRDVQGESAALSTVASLHGKAGDFDQAYSAHHHAIEAARALSPHDEMAALDSTGDTYALQERFAEAIDHYQQALTRAEQNHNLNSQAQILRKLGDVYRNSDKASDAARMYRSALSIIEQLGGHGEDEVRAALASLSIAVDSHTAENVE